MKLGWTVGKLAARRLLDSRVGDKDIELGEALTEQLDQMKGLAMKLGQIVSYMDVPLPEVVQERLARLQAGTSGLGEAETTAALELALGADFRRHFEYLDLRPFAAASIGQVHRGRVRGRDIVLKLQYPHVTQSFHGDIDAMNRIASLASLASAVDGKAIVRELAERLEEECDYEREAQAQTRFRDYFQTDPALDIPEVLSDLSTKTTLVTTFVAGASAADALLFSDDVRSRIALGLVRFSYRSLLAGCAIQADPHPGNFKFMEDGRVACLDFGCVRTFEPDFVELLRRMLRALDGGDRRLFRSTVIDLEMAPRPSKFDFEHHFSMMEHLHRPLLADEFRFTPEYVKAGLNYNGPSNPNARTMAMPPAYVWVARLQWGLWSLLARLNARISAREFTQELLLGTPSPIFFEEPPQKMGSRPPASGTRH